MEQLSHKEPSGQGGQAWSSGEDFEGSPGFQALMVALAGKPERVMGDAVIPAEPPDWAEVRRQTTALMAASPGHVALHTALAQAATALGGFAGLRDALAGLETWLAEAWDSLYPEADEEDPDDPYYARVNLMRDLAEQPAFLDLLYRTPLVKVRGIGAFSTRDIDIALGLLAGSEEDKARCQEALIRGALAETDATELTGIADAIDGARAACRGIEQLFAERSGQSGLLSLDALITRLTLCYDRLVEMAGERLQATSEPLIDTTAPVDLELDPATEPAPPGTGEAAADAAVSHTSSLADQAACSRAFDAVIAYYRQREPSSPVALLADQARSLVGLSFFELLQALAPAGGNSLGEQLSALDGDPLAGLIEQCFVRWQSGGTAGEPDSAAEAAAGSAIAVPQSRAEVLALLADIEAYFREAEPASPIPLIVADMRRLVPRSFTELLSEFRRRTAGPAVDEAAE